MDTKQAISNLELTSKALDQAANKPQNYNTEWAYYLEQMSWELHKYAADLRQIEGISSIEFEKNIYGL